jgi:hypothetical protein
MRRPTETRYPDRTEQVEKAVVRADEAMERVVRLIEALQLETVVERERKHK